MKFIDALLGISEPDYPPVFLEINKEFERIYSDEFDYMQSIFVRPCDVDTNTDYTWEMVYDHWEFDEILICKFKGSDAQKILGILKNSEKKKVRQSFLPLALHDVKVEWGFKDF